MLEACPKIKRYITMLLEQKLYNDSAIEYMHPEFFRQIPKKNNELGCMFHLDACPKIKYISK